MAKNKKSTAFHQRGASVQQVDEQALATKMKGVATQWMKHNVLAVTPMISGLTIFRARLINLNF